MTDLKNHFYSILVSHIAPLKIDIPKNFLRFKMFFKPLLYTLDVKMIDILAFYLSWWVFGDWGIDFAFMFLLQLFLSNNFPYLASCSKIEELLKYNITWQQNNAATNQSWNLIDQEKTCLSSKLWTMKIIFSIVFYWKLKSAFRKSAKGKCKVRIKIWVIFGWTIRIEFWFLIRFGNRQFVWISPNQVHEYMG